MQGLVFRPGDVRFQGKTVEQALAEALGDLSLNGERFVSDRATPLNDGDTLLLLSADVGG